MEQPHVHPRLGKGPSQIAVTVGYCRAFGQFGYLNKNYSSVSSGGGPRPHRRDGGSGHPRARHLCRSEVVWCGLLGLPRLGQRPQLGGRAQKSSDAGRAMSCCVASHEVRTEQEHGVQDLIQDLRLRLKFLKQAFFRCEAFH